MFCDVILDLSANIYNTYAEATGHSSSPVETPKGSWVMLHIYNEYQCSECSEEQRI